MEGEREKKGLWNKGERQGRRKQGKEEKHTEERRIKFAMNLKDGKTRDDVKRMRSLDNINRKKINREESRDS